ncbi:hypothetical protein JCM10908_002512 [Rhodotorula pacifica]|uniref:uncharacterized protein n=1 Tax=Rhodotorula pacifica TaxID=1495444 RepID=UPI00316C613E
MARLYGHDLDSVHSAPEPSDLYQIAQYTCIYDALHRTVQCKPFVRTFMKQANGLMSEVTTFVNAGRAVPRAGLDVPPKARMEKHVPVGSRPPASVG